MMNVYLSNKLISLGSVSIFIFLTTYLFPDKYQGWQIILLGIVIFGYSHFFVGFYYQLKSFARKDFPQRYYISFAITVLLSILVAQILFHYISFAGALLVALLYFLFHGFLNEHTLLEKQSGIQLPIGYLAALAIFIIALLFHSIPDETFFFSKYLEFIPTNEFLIRSYLTEVNLSLDVIRSIFGLGVVSSLGLVLWTAYQTKKYLAAKIIATIIATILSAVVFFGPPLYVHMYALVVGYHFFTWFLFYYSSMKNRGPVIFNQFLILHAVVVVPLLIAAVFFLQPATNEMVRGIFSYQLFGVFTYIHISTSFINDDWFVRIQTRIAEAIQR